MILPGIFASQISGHLYSGPAGAFDALGSVTVGSGGLSSITFSAIPQTYTHLQIRFIARESGATTTDNFAMQLNGDSGSNYAYHILYGDGSSAAATAGTSATSMAQFRIAGASATSGVFGAAVIDIMDYAVTTKNKTIRTLGGADNNGSGIVSFNSGLWMNTAAVNSLVLTAGSGNFAQYSNFSLYGAR